MVAVEESKALSRSSTSPTPPPPPSPSALLFGRCQTSLERYGERRHTNKGRKTRKKLWTINVDVVDNSQTERDAEGEGEGESDDDSSSEENEDEIGDEIDNENGAKVDLDKDNGSGQEPRKRYEGQQPRFHMQPPHHMDDNIQAHEHPVQPPPLTPVYQEHLMWNATPLRYHQPERTIGSVPVSSISASPQIASPTEFNDQRAPYVYPAQFRTRQHAHITDQQQYHVDMVSPSLQQHALPPSMSSTSAPYFCSYGYPYPYNPYPSLYYYHLLLGPSPLLIQSSSSSSAATTTTPSLPSHPVLYAHHYKPSVMYMPYTTPAPYMAPDQLPFPSLPHYPPPFNSSVSQQEIPVTSSAIASQPSRSDTTTAVKAATLFADYKSTIHPSFSFSQTQSRIAGNSAMYMRSIPTEQKECSSSSLQHSPERVLTPHTAQESDGKMLLSQNLVISPNNRRSNDPAITKTNSVAVSAIRNDSSAPCSFSPAICAKADETVLSGSIPSHPHVLLPYSECSVTSLSQSPSLSDSSPSPALFTVSPVPLSFGDSSSAHTSSSIPSARHMKSHSHSHRSNAVLDDFHITLHDHLIPSDQNLSPLIETRDQHVYRTRAASDELFVSSNKHVTDDSSPYVTHQQRVRGKQIMHIATDKRVFQVTEYTASYDENTASSRRSFTPSTMLEKSSANATADNITLHSYNPYHHAFHYNSPTVINALAASASSTIQGHQHHASPMHSHNPHQPHPFMMPHPSQDFSSNGAAFFCPTSLVAVPPVHPTTHTNSKKIKKTKAHFDHIAYSELVFHEMIGEGSFGQVFRGTLYGQEVAIKKIRISSRDNFLSLMKDFKKEWRIMKALRHPNIVEFLGAVAQPPHLCLVTEFLSRGSLESVLTKMEQDMQKSDASRSVQYTGKWSLKYVISLGKDIVRGVNWLHKRSIIHRDLKTANILLDNNGKAKLCDFGLSHVKRRVNTNGAYGACGSLGYSAPEVLKRQHYGVAADTYSFGVCLCELLAGKYPYEDEGKTMGTVVFEKALIRGLKPTIPAYCPSNLRQMIEDCLHEDPGKRPAMEDIFNELVSAEQTLSALETHSMFDDCPEKILEVIRAQRRDLDVLEAAAKVSNTQMQVAAVRINELELKLDAEKIAKEKAEAALAAIQATLTLTPLYQTAPPPSHALHMLQRGSSAASFASLTSVNVDPLQPLNVPSRRASIVSPKNAIHQRQPTVSILPNVTLQSRRSSITHNSQSPMLSPHSKTSNQSSQSPTSQRNDNKATSPLSQHIPLSSSLVSSVSAPVDVLSGQPPYPLRQISFAPVSPPACISPVSAASLLQL